MARSRSRSRYSGPFTHGPQSRLLMLPLVPRQKLGPNPAPTALSGDCVRNPGSDLVVSVPPLDRLAIWRPCQMNLSKEEVMVTMAKAERGTSVRRLARPTRGDGGSAAVPAEKLGGGTAQRRVGGSTHGAGRLRGGGRGDPADAGG